MPETDKVAEVSVPRSSSALWKARLSEFQWRGEGSFAAWLFRIAHNRVSDFYRRGHGAEESVPLDELPELETNDLLPADAALQKEKRAATQNSPR